MLYKLVKIVQRVDVQFRLDSSNHSLYQIKLLQKWCTILTSLYSIWVHDLSISISSSFGTPNAVSSIYETYTMWNNLHPRWQTTWSQVNKVERDEIEARWMDSIETSLFPRHDSQLFCWWHFVLAPICHQHESIDESLKDWLSMPMTEIPGMQNSHLQKYRLRWNSILLWCIIV